MRPLSESVNDLFREVSLLRRRITELSHRLATLEPFLRHHGYREDGAAAGEEEEALTPLGLRGDTVSLARPGPPRSSRVVRRRRVRVQPGGGRLLQREMH